MTPVLGHLVEDPGETRNLVGERSEVAQRYRDRLHQTMRIEDEEPSRQLDPETIERLRALGYLAD